MVHVDAQGRRRRRGGQAALGLSGVGKGKAQAAEFFGNEQTQVTSGAKILEILGEEFVALVVAGRAVTEGCEHVLGKHVLDRGHLVSSKSKIEWS